jgi:hypothetical protein
MKNMNRQKTSVKLFALTKIVMINPQMNDE